MSSEGGRSTLENAFRILRFRHRDHVSFRRFIIMRLWPGRAANGLPDAEATQPTRVKR